MKYFILLISILSVDAWSTEAGFMEGSTFQSVNIQGKITVRCFENGRSDIIVHRCKRNILEPTSHDRFVYGGETNAKKVRLTATHEDGSTRDKKKKFYRSKGHSKRFNLWISSLTQRPLLHMGVNRINYEMIRGDDILDEGEFEVTVESGEPRTCRSGTYSSSNMDDCRYPDSMCPRHFRNENGCR